MKKIILFSTPACVYCHTLKKYLEKKGVEFKEIDITEDEEAKEEMVKNTEQMGVPVLKVDDQYIIGFDKKKIEELL